MSPTHRQTKRAPTVGAKIGVFVCLASSETYKNTNFRSYSRRAYFDLPKLCMLIENVVTIQRGVNHFSIQRIVFPLGAKMLIFGH